MREWDDGNECWVWVDASAEDGRLDSDDNCSSMEEACQHYDDYE